MAVGYSKLLCPSLLSLHKVLCILHCGLCSKLPHSLRLTLAPNAYNITKFRYGDNKELPHHQLTPWKKLSGTNRVISPLPAFDFDFNLPVNTLPELPVPLHASFVNATDCIVQDSSELKGVVGSLNKLFRSKPIFAYSCTHFCLRFYLEYQYTGLIRKTKPGILLKTYGQSYNSSSAQKIPASSDTRTVNPFDYAVHRRRTRRVYKKLFFDGFTGRDGLYEFTIFKFPLQGDMAYIKDRIYHCLDKVNGLNEKSLRSRGPNELQFIDKGLINKQCKLSGLPILLNCN